MDKILLFNYCAVPIYLIILSTTFVRRTTKGRVNRLFIITVALCLASAIIDFLADGYGPFMPLSPFMRNCVAVANYLYFIVRNLIPLVYLLFLMALIKTRFSIRKKYMKAIVFFPYSVVIFVLLANPFHQKAFVVTATEGYVRGPLLSVFYAVSLLYSLVGTFYLIYSFRFLRLGKWLALMSMYILSFVGIFIQLFFPNVLIEIFSTAIALLLIILMVLRPEEITDTNVGLPSWKAYRDELYKITRIHRPVQIDVIKFINATEVREYLGEEKFNAYIMQIVREIEKLARRKKLVIDMYYEAPGHLYFIFDADYLDEFYMEKQFASLVNEVRAATQEVEKSGVYLRGRLCTIFYPRDLNDESTIIQLGHFFHELIPEGQKSVRAEELVGTRKYELTANMAAILNRANREKLYDIHYQPIFDLETKTFRSAEALVRLNDPYFGEVQPSVFVPRAEESGAIIRIGDYVLDQVFRFVSETNFKELGLDYVEINLSVSQCFQVNLPDKIFALQKKYNVNPSCINFEITETTYSDIGNVAKKNIECLVEAGYSFSLDDYGTGFSNMQRIMGLPISIVKLDKSMIDQIYTEDGASLVRNTIKMMRDIRMHVLAEGVEEAEQLEKLMQMDCNYIQGFYFSKPLPEKHFVEFLREHNHRGE